MRYATVTDFAKGSFCQLCCFLHPAFCSPAIFDLLYFTANWPLHTSDCWLFSCCPLHTANCLLCCLRQLLLTSPRSVACQCFFRGRAAHCLRKVPGPLGVFLAAIKRWSGRLILNSLVTLSQAQGDGFNLHVLVFWPLPAFDPPVMTFHSKSTYVTSLRSQLLERPTGGLLRIAGAQQGRRLSWNQ